jgi:hypothetical protein
VSGKLMIVTGALRAGMISTFSGIRVAGRSPNIAARPYQFPVVN